MNDLDRCLEVV